MKKDINKKIIIGFSIGDYNSIGPEIFLKSFHQPTYLKIVYQLYFVKSLSLTITKKNLK